MLQLEVIYYLVHCMHERGGGREEAGGSEGDEGGEREGDELISTKHIYTLVSLLTFLCGLAGQTFFFTFNLLHE